MKTKRQKNRWRQKSKQSDRQQERQQDRDDRPGCLEAQNGKSLESSSVPDYNIPESLCTQQLGVHLPRLPSDDWTNEARVLLSAVHQEGGR